MFFKVNGGEDESGGKRSCSKSLHTNSGYRHVTRRLILAHAPARVVGVLGLVIACVSTHETPTQRRWNYLAIFVKLCSFTLMSAEGSKSNQSGKSPGQEHQLARETLTEQGG